MESDKEKIDKKEKIKDLRERIKKHLEDNYDGDNSDIGFRGLVEVSANKGNPMVRYHKEELLNLNSIRNHLVHDKKIIKDLKEEGVEEFEDIARKICSPEKVLPRFRKDIYQFNTDDGLLNVLEYMRSNDYSQVVVDCEGFLSLLTVEGISKWLESEAGTGGINAKKADVSDALGHETKDSFTCMSSSKSVFAARDAFEKALEERGSRLFAIIITNTGNRAESPLGIITPWDLAHVSL